MLSQLGLVGFVAEQVAEVAEAAVERVDEHARAGQRVAPPRADVEVHAETSSSNTSLESRDARVDSS